MDRLDLLIVGALAHDEDVFAGLTDRRTGGAVYFGGYAALAAGARTGIWTPLADGDLELLESLRRAGIAVFRSPSAHTSGIRNIYTTADRDRRTCRPLARATPLLAADLPDCGARIIHVAPLMAGEVPDEVLRAAADRAELGLDAQGVLRCVEGDELVFRDWPDKREGLSRVTYLKADAAEAEVLTGLLDPAEAARALADMGPREVVVTRSDAVRLLVDGRLHEAPFTAGNLSGRTGRGDTCMASYLARRLLGDPPEQALRFAATLTSMKMERKGPFDRIAADVFARMEREESP